MNNKTRYIVYSGVLIALGILFQSIRILFPGLALVNLGPFNLQTLIIGSLVNLVIIIASWYVGLWSGIAVSVVSPVYALMLGHLPIPHMLIVVAVGNSLLAIFVRVFYSPKLGTKSAIGILTGVIAKFLAQWALVSIIVVPFFAPNAKIAAALGIGFSWVQLVTGILGGVLAFALYPRLKSYRASQK